MATAGLTVSTSWSPGHPLRDHMGIKATTSGSDSSDEELSLRARSERSSSNPVRSGKQEMDPMDVP